MVRETAFVKSKDRALTQFPVSACVLSIICAAKPGTPICPVG
jgi:hypothetical protein